MELISTMEKSPSGVETLYTGYDLLGAKSMWVWRNIITTNIISQERQSGKGS